MSNPALLKRCAVDESWVGPLRFPRFGDSDCCCLRAGVADSSRAAEIPCGLPCSSVAVDVVARRFATGVSLLFDVSTFEAVPLIESCVLKGSAPFGLLNVDATFAACFSAAMAAHLRTLLAAVTASSSSSITESIENLIRLRLLESTVAFNAVLFRLLGDPLLA